MSNSVNSLSPRTKLPRSPLWLQLPSPLPTTRQPAPMLSFPHALAHAVAAPSRSGSPGAQVVSRQRLSICGTERQDLLQYENSCESFVVEARKDVSSGTFLPQKRGESVISPPTPSPACISIACAKQGCRIRHTGPVQRGQFGRLRPVAASGLQLSLQSTRSHVSERKAAHDTKLSLPKFFLQKSSTVDTSRSRIFTSFCDPTTGCSVSMSAQRTDMSRYTQLQCTTSAFIWRSRRHMWMLPAAPSRFLFSQELTGRCPTAQWANIRWWRERAQHCRSDTPAHLSFGPRSSRSWLKQ